ncbi:hypothetical protein MTF66_06540 [Pseudoalteromonas sp. 2CM39R]|uniref:hypothetical protein n=1 Tax=Pseudoalteromonas sp. 2CM39R TaxID=2929856 RepID=UPI0020BF74D4|nr:hypothetical protein [Pseudoalteromonas sp. 2CM39R]MCK8124649.1 hypothetical protein [Pseudoalteromonas sp. 2CM39R]
MLKKLDKYMDNLKSPYLEVYFWIVVIASAIAGTTVIFIDPMGLASKFGNAGSFLGGLFTIAAVFVAVIAYKSNIRSHHNKIILEAFGELSIEIIPKLLKTIESDSRKLRVDVYKLINGNSDVSKEVSDRVKKRFYTLEELKNKIKVKMNYINVYSNNQKGYPEPFKELINIINEQLKFSYYLVNEDKDLRDPIELKKYLEWVEEGLSEIDFYNKYIKRSVELKGGLTIQCDKNELRVRLIQIRDNLFESIKLKPH